MENLLFLGVPILKHITVIMEMEPSETSSERLEKRKIALAIPGLVIYRVIQYTTDASAILSAKDLARRRHAALSTHCANPDLTTIDLI